MTNPNYEAAMERARAIRRAPSPLSYEYSRERSERWRREGGPTRQDALEALLLGLNAVAPGRAHTAPRSNPVGPPAAEVFDMPGMRSAGRINAIDDVNPAGWPRSLHYPANAHHSAPPRLEVVPPAPQTKGGAPHGVRGFVERTTEVPKGAASAAETRFGPIEQPVTTEAVLRFMQDAGIDVTRVKVTPTDSTTYIKFNSPDNPRRANRQSQPTVRIPEVDHAGRTAKYEDIGAVFDTATQPNRHHDINPLTALNEGGRPYADFRNLTDAIKWRTSRSPDGQWLVAPDQAPAGVRHQAPLEPAPAARPEGPDIVPEQGRLLSVAAPAAIGGWVTTVTPESDWQTTVHPEGNVGRFAARRLVEDPMITDTRALTDRVRGAADATHYQIPLSIYQQRLAQMLEAR